MNTPVYEFAMVFRSPEHIEIVNITKNPLDPTMFTYLGSGHPKAPSIKLFSHNDCLEQVRAENNIGEE